MLVMLRLNKGPQYETPATLTAVLLRPLAHFTFNIRTGEAVWQRRLLLLLLLLLELKHFSQDRESVMMDRKKDNSHQQRYFG